MSTRLEIKTILALHYLNSEDVRAGEAGKMAEATLNDLIHELAEEMIEAISKPENHPRLGWEDAVRTIQRIHGIVPPNPCPYTHTHTRHWCGYDQCRKS